MGEGGNKTQGKWIKNWGNVRNWHLWVGEGIQHEGNGKTIGDTVRNLGLQVGRDEIFLELKSKKNVK